MLFYLTQQTPNTTLGIFFKWLMRYLALFFFFLTKSSNASVYLFTAHTHAPLNSDLPHLSKCLRTVTWLTAAVPNSAVQEYQFLVTTSFLSCSPTSLPTFLLSSYLSRFLKIQLLWNLLSNAYPNSSSP